VVTVEGVAQVDLVSQGVAQLDSHELPVPGPLHVLLPVAFREVVGFERELGPDGGFACEESRYVI